MVCEYRSQTTRNDIICRRADCLSFTLLSVRWYCNRLVEGLKSSLETMNTSLTCASFELRDDRGLEEFLREERGSVWRCTSHDE